MRRGVEEGLRVSVTEVPAGAWKNVETAIGPVSGAPVVRVEYLQDIVVDLDGHIVVDGQALIGRFDFAASTSIDDIVIAFVDADEPIDAGGGGAGGALSDRRRFGERRQRVEGRTVGRRGQAAIWQPM